MKQRRELLPVLIAAIPILTISLLLYRGNQAPTVAAARSVTESTTASQPTETHTTATQAVSDAVELTAPTMPPITETALYTGAYPEMQTEFPLDENGLPLHYTRTVEGTACAYTAKEGAVTATGTTPQWGTVAVNPKLISYGTKLFIASESGYIYGYAVAEDTGGDLLNNKILVDLYMDTREECINFGRQAVTVYVLE